MKRRIAFAVAALLLLGGLLIVSSRYTGTPGTERRPTKETQRPAPGNFEGSGLEPSGE